MYYNVFNLSLLDGNLVYPQVVIIISNAMMNTCVLGVLA